MSFNKKIEQGYNHQQAGRYYEAEMIYQGLLQHYGRQPDTLFLYGLLASKIACPSKALSLFQEAINLRPNQANYHFNLGLAYRELGELDQAYSQFNRSVILAPNDINKHIALANLLDFMHQEKSAISHFDKMIERWPNEGAIYHSYGLTLMRCDQANKAMIMLRKAIALGNNIPRCMRAIAFLKKFTNHDDPDIKVMETALANKTINQDDQAGLCFALSKTYDDLSDIHHSFEHLARGNAIKRQSYLYDLEEDRVMFDRIKKVFNKTLFERHKGAGTHNDSPIFVLGMPRSGTSLVEQILSSHPEVAGAGELHDLRQVYLGQDSALTRANYPEAVEELNNTILTNMGDVYIKRLRQHSDTATHIVDKMPHNFLAIGMIALMLPEARIIHCQRDPVDTCFSCLKQNFSGILSHQYAYDMREMGGYYRLYMDIMTHWRTVLPGRFLDVSYETLVEDQENETRRMIEYLDLPWNDACLSFHNNKRAVHTASVTQVRQPMYRHAIKAWQHYETQLAPLVAALNNEAYTTEQ